MRLASYVTHGRSGFGAVVGNGVVDMRLRFGPRFTSLLDILRDDALAEVLAALTGVRADYPLSEIELLRPIVQPEKIICVGVNETEPGAEAPVDAAKYPNLYFRAPGALVGHGQPILRPRESVEFDCEGEIALVIGREGRRIPPDRAFEFVAGYTLCNGGAASGFLPQGWDTITPRKNFDASGSLGPWLVTCDEIDPAQPLRLTTRVNGELRRDHTSASLPFSFPDLVAFISIFTTLKPGDVIATGVPVAAAERLDPPRWLRPGDVVETAVPEIGLLRNVVIDEP
jgi:2-keto-4-pentenoate hydratase/2-oxohepta-3-ene-1,7-dioic acid hydratase in catechol pathway